MRDPVAAAAQGLAARPQADLLISVGGGSTGTARIVARETATQILAVPTTYAGSEMTPGWGMTTEGRKENGTVSRVQPQEVVYDPALIAARARRALDTTASPVSGSFAVDSTAHLTQGPRHLCAGQSRQRTTCCSGPAWRA